MLVGLIVVVLVVALPAFYEAYRTIASPEPQVSGQLSQDDVRVMEELGISLDVYAAFQTAQIAFVSLVFTIAGALLFWRKPTDRMVVFISVWFMLLGPIGSPLLDPLIRVHSAWELPVRGLQGATMGCLPIFTYVFPDGHFVPRWTRMLTLFWIVWLVLAPFTPFAIGDFAGPSALWFGVLLPGGMAIGILAQVYRYRRVSTRLEQQQVKWVLFGFGVVALGIFLYSLVPLVFPSVLVPGLPKLLFELLGGPVLIVLPLCLLPLCIGIAILRYRLWDIDHLINRTLVYGALTATLALVYSASVVLLQYSLRFLTGQGTSQLAVVVSTLTLAAAFQPLRRRIQTGIDRRFYRRKYDMVRTLAAFNAQLRNEVNLDLLASDLIGVIELTLQPAHVSLWLRDSGSSVRHEHVEEHLSQRAPETYNSNPGEVYTVLLNSQHSPETNEPRRIDDK
jgi:hypothetical protein